MVKGYTPSTFALRRHDEDHPPFGRIEVDPQLCIGYKKCPSKRPDGSFLDGCPWDAIEMVSTEEVASRLGTKFQF
jgi:ferredoxin